MQIYIKKNIKNKTLIYFLTFFNKRKVNQSIEQIQNRDKIKIKEIEKCGYTPYVIKDMGKYNKAFVENELKKFIDYYENKNVFIT